METVIINTQMKPDLKDEVEKILAKLGMSTTQAIILFFEEIKSKQTIPFDLNIPNEETIAAMQDAQHNFHLEKVSIEQLKNQTGRLFGRHKYQLTIQGDIVSPLEVRWKALN